MCDHCIMESVKRKMLSRRNFLKSAPIAGAAAAVGVATAPASLAQGANQIIDMTHVIDPEFPTWSGTPGIASEQLGKFDPDGFNAFSLTVSEHTGTHIDAPLHFSADGNAVHEIPVESLVCPLCVIDIREKADADIEAEITPDDIKAWMSDHGDIPDGACVAMNSGWQKHIGTSKFVGLDDKGVRHYPGFNVEAANMLMEETGAISIATDSLSLDIGSTETYGTHYAWLPTNRYGIENIANLDKVPAFGATLFVGAPTHRGGSGGPARIIAMV